MTLRLVLECLNPHKVDQGGGFDAHYGISTRTHILRNFALTVLATCPCLLPASNVKFPWSTQHLIPWMTGAAFVLWLLARITGRRPPQPHERAAWWITAFISAGGWLISAFPKAMVERSTGAILELDKNPWLTFGTLDQTASMQSMLSISLSLMMLLMLLDFASERHGRHLMALAVTISGFLAALAGLTFRSTPELHSLWQAPHVPDSVFGLFWYHGNAAAFLNLSWPVGIWLFMNLLHARARQPRQQMMMACLLTAVLAQVIAVCVNASKMGHLMLIFEAGLMVMAGLWFWRRRHGDFSFDARHLLVLAALGIGLLLLGAWLGGAGDGMKRWNIFAERHFDDPARRHAAVMALRIGWDHGCLGAGPGTFEWVAAHYATLDPVLESGRWRHAHNDYAEFFAEWGWLGAVIFVLVLALPGRRLLGSLREVFSNESHHTMSFHRRTGLVCFSIALVAALMHAWVDFPLQIDATRHLFAIMTGLALAMTASMRLRKS